MTARAVVAALLAAALAPGVGLTVASPAIASPSPQVEVIVRESPGSGDGPERLVELVGGTVVNQLPVIDGFLARVSKSGIATLRASSEVVAVSPNAAVQLTGSFDGFSPKDDQGSMYWVGQEVTGAGEFWNAGFRGQGVDVALIDSGVAPVDGLTAPDKVLHGPDLSFESQHDAFRNIDTYGHGTHMAGIIAGRDTSTPQPVQKGVENHFVGMAPEARVLSIKVADSHGNTDVSQVIAAIDWVVEHRSDPGLNIKVLNLSFGTDGVQDYRFDPLSYAAEVAWRAGIVVVVAAGNGGDGSEKLNNPAYDPFVLAVGGADGQDTYGVSDDVIASFSSHGDAARAPDLVALAAVAGLAGGHREPRRAGGYPPDPRHGDVPVRGGRVRSGSAGDLSAPGHHARPGQEAAHVDRPGPARGRLQGAGRGHDRPEGGPHQGDTVRRQLRAGLCPRGRHRIPGRQPGQRAAELRRRHVERRAGHLRRAVRVQHLGAVGSGRHQLGGRGMEQQPLVGRWLVVQPLVVQPLVVQPLVGRGLELG